MDLNRLDAWTAVVSESSPATIERLGLLVDFSNPPDFFDFIGRQWQKRQEGDSRAWDVLMEGQVLLRAVGLPSVLTLPQALTVTGYAQQCDPLFDSKLLRRLLAHRLWPEEVPVDEVMRTLDVLETLDETHRLAMTLLRFSKFPHSHVQSKVARILGRCVDNVGVIEEIYDSPDGRVRANLLEGIGQRKALELFLPLIERATTDQHTRVSSVALALRARAGHSGSRAIIKMRTNSKMPIIRKSAEIAQQIAAGEAPVREAPAEVSASLGALAGELAVTPAVEEVDSKA
jgi:hypothetical protein